MLPKFRAWDKAINEMIPWRKLLNVYNLRNVFIRPETCGLVLMQSTGLKDKNGVEIFEGDIVAIKYSESGYHYYEKIVFENGTFTAGDEDWLYNIKDYCVVCGNIYENPELLEKANEI